jgi:ABC-type glycerol-3-phosphate transport system permease component
MTATDRGTAAVPAVAAARRRRGRRATQRSLAGSIVLWVLLGLGAVFILLPLVWMLSTAFKQPDDAFAVPPHWLSKPTGANFSELLTGEFRKYVLNSLLVSVMTTVIALAFGIPAGYAFARTRIRGGKFIQAWFVLAYVIPPVIFIIPLYIIYQHAHLLDSYTGLVLAYETGILPFTVWLMRAYMSEVPRELDEAAWIDGCSKLGALWRVVLPTVLPGITTVGLMVGLGRVLRGRDPHRPEDADRAGGGQLVRRPAQLGLEQAGRRRRGRHRARAAGHRLRAARVRPGAVLRRRQAVSSSAAKRSWAARWKPPPPSCPLYG